MSTSTVMIVLLYSATGVASIVIGIVHGRYMYEMGRRHALGDRTLHHEIAANNLSSLLVEAREARGLTLAQVAAELGCEESYVEVIEGGRVFLGPLIEPIERVYGLPTGTIPRNVRHAHTSLEK